MNLPPLLPQFSLLLPDIRSGFNVGAFFRTADALGIDHIFLSGLTPYPPHPEIHKTALGAEEMVPWSYHGNATELVRTLQEQQVHLIALENIPTAQSLSEFIPQFPLCLIVGNERNGVPSELLEEVETTLKIAMRGQKESLNVSIAGAIALWEISQKKVQ